MEKINDGWMSKTPNDAAISLANKIRETFPNLVHHTDVELIDLVKGCGAVVVDCSRDDDFNLTMAVDKFQFDYLKNQPAKIVS